MRRRSDNTTSIVRAHEDLRSEYAIGTESRYIPRLHGVDAAGTGADYHIAGEANFLKGIERARAIDRENMIVGQAITRLVDNVLQDKLPLDPATGNDKLDDELYDRWEEWCADAGMCHSRRMHDLHTLAKMTLRATIVDGDILALPLRSGALQMIEAHRLRTPRTTKRNVIHGVLLDGQGAPAEYWIAKETKDAYQRIERVGDVEARPAFDENGDPSAFHVFNPKRVSQTRGVTTMAPLLYPTVYHDDLQFAKLVQAKAASVFAFIFKQPFGGAAGGGHTMGSTTVETQTDGTARLLQELAPGMVLTTRPGEEVVGFSPNIPNNEYFQHITLILTIIAVNLGLPVAVLMLDPTKTNFSGWRGAIDQARIGFKEIQRWMVQRFFSPIYRWQVRRWLEADPSLARLAARAKVSPYRHKFNRPKWAYIEPLKDAQADELRLGGNLISHTELCDERGDDWDERHRQIVQDRAKLIRAALEAAEELNAAFADAGVHWRDLASGRFAELPQGPQPEETGTQDPSDENDEEEAT